jgi:hypothetical protein
LEKFSESQAAFETTFRFGSFLKRFSGRISNLISDFIKASRKTVI